ncbi:MAG: hypothetical protein AAF726_15735 [Planctomycetota bacterium]
MHDLPIHIVLFLLTTAIVVAVSCMYTEADDGRALRLFPRRYTVFVVVSGLVVAAMLLLEHTLASVS